MFLTQRLSSAFGVLAWDWWSYNDCQHHFLANQWSSRGYCLTEIRKSTRQILFLDWDTSGTYILRAARNIPASLSDPNLLVKVCDKRLIILSLVRSQVPRTALSALVGRWISLRCRPIHSFILKRQYRRSLLDEQEVFHLDSAAAVRPPSSVRLKPGPRSCSACSTFIALYSRLVQNSQKPQC